MGTGLLNGSSLCVFIIVRAVNTSSPPPPQAQPTSLQPVLIGAAVLVMMGEAGEGREAGCHSHPLLCAPGVVG